MNIADFIDKWIAKMDKFTDSSGKITLSKNQVLQLRLDIYGLRKYDPFIGNETKYVSVFEASQEWWNARGVFSIESIAAKYNIKFETLNEYINSYLKIQEWVEPFKEEYTIWELYFLAKRGKPQELYFISDPHETV